MPVDVRGRAGAGTPVQVNTWKAGEGVAWAKSGPDRKTSVG